MRILITGGFGLVGGRLGEHLLEFGHEVLLGTRSLSHRLDACLPGAMVVETNWNKEEFLEDLCQDIDVVIHAAGMNSVDCSLSPEQALVINGVATSKLLAAAIRSKVPRFIYFSTAQVYGSTLIGDITEQSPTQNIHPYATTHLAGEHAVRYAHQQNLISGLVIRLANSYGAPMHKGARCWSLLVNDLCRQAVISRKMVLHSSGRQKRNFVPISTVCVVIRQLIDQEQTELGNGLFNLGGHYSIKVREMADIVKARCEILLGKEVELSTKVLPNSENEFRYSIEKIERLGIKLEINHNEEIDRTIDFCLNNFVDRG